MMASDPRPDAELLNDDRLTCTNCGKRYNDSQACGPTHAVMAGEVRRAPYLASALYLSRSAQMPDPEAIATLRVAAARQGRDAALARIAELESGLPVVECPSCGASIRARMADAESRAMLDCVARCEDALGDERRSDSLPDDIRSLRARVAELEAEAVDLRRRAERRARNLAGYGPNMSGYTVTEVEDIENEKAAALDRISELEADNADLQVAHRLMSSQFQTMQREKDHGWDLAERSADERDAALARIAAVEALCDDEPIIHTEPGYELDVVAVISLRAALAALAGNTE